MRPSLFKLVGCILLAIPVAACDALSTLAPQDGRDARSLTGQYAWIHQTWNQGAPVGFAAAELAWSLPPQYNREVFRIYARSASTSGYGLIATVTSCSESVCRYTDTNVAPGRSYDYYVASVDERTGSEIGTSVAVRVDIPQRPQLAAPAAPAVISLDRAAYVRWTVTGAHRVMLLVQPENGTLFVIGETDGTSFYDDRAENGARYRYYVATVDEWGHVSPLSQPADAYPRPDFHSDVIYASNDLLSASGFRFVASETEDPIVPGVPTSAQWRLDVINGEFRIQPLSGAAIVAHGFTTQLTCGPGSDASCVDVRVVPTNAAFSTASFPVQAGFTYLVRVVGSDGRYRYGKIRVQGTSRDSAGLRLMIFDWAYQLRPDERNLDLVPFTAASRF
jgi:hypothetical protein